MKGPPASRPAATKMASRNPSATTATVMSRVSWRPLRSAGRARGTTFQVQSYDMRRGVPFLRAAGAVLGSKCRRPERPPVAGGWTLAVRRASRQRAISSLREVGGIGQPVLGLGGLQLPGVRVVLHHDVQRLKVVVEVALADRERRSLEVDDRARDDQAELFVRLRELGVPRDVVEEARDPAGLDGDAGLVLV